MKGFNMVRSFLGFKSIVKFNLISLFMLAFTPILNVNVSWALSSHIHGFDLVLGKKMDISFEEAEKATVVIFLSARCPCSASHQGVINLLSKEFKAPEFRFVGIHSNSDENLETARNHFKEAFEFPVIQDEQAILADEFRAYKTPHVFVLGPKRQVLFQGGVDNSHHAHQATKHYLKEALVAIREGKEILEKEVRVLGCAIKRP
jgi:peroxiredoxin